MAIAGDPLVFEGPSTDDLHLISGNVHFNQQALDLHSARWFEQIVANRIVPEPSSLLLAIVGLLALLPVARMRRR